MTDSEFRVSDLAGCDVVTQEGEWLGRLADVLPTGGNDVFVVRSDVREYLIPGLKSVVRTIDLSRRRIEVALPPGLREIYET